MLTLEEIAIAPPKQIKECLKNLRDQGVDVQVKLNQKCDEFLRPELKRIIESGIEFSSGLDLETPLKEPSFGQPTIIINPDIDSGVVEALKTEEELGFDIETTMTPPESGGFIRLYQWYIPSLDTCLILDTKEPFDNTLLEIFKEVLQNQNQKKIIHNSLFEYGWIRSILGVKIKNTLDTMVLNQLVKAGLFRAYKAAGLVNSNSLETLSIEYGLNLDKRFQKYDYGSDESIPYPVYQYAGNDPKATWWLSKNLPYPDQDIDLKVTSLFGELNYNGFPVNINKLKTAYATYIGTYESLFEELSTKLTEADSWYYTTFYRHYQDSLNSSLSFEEYVQKLPRIPLNLKIDGEIQKKAITLQKSQKLSDKEKIQVHWNSLKEIWTVNPNSPAQLLRWVIREYKETPLAFDRKKKCLTPSTNKSALNQFIAKFQKDNPDRDLSLLKKIQAMRSIKKCSDYPKEYLKSIRGNRAFGHYRILGYQGEGRSSCSDSNHQNIPKLTEVRAAYGLPDLRKCFEETDDRRLISIDISAAHAAIAADLSKDRKLAEARETGIKLHFYTLQTMFAQQGVLLTPGEIKAAYNDKDNPYHKRTKEMYKLSKNTFYSYLNFSGAATLQNTFCNDDVIISIEVCRDYLAATAKTFCDLRFFQEQIIQKVQQRYRPMFAANNAFLGKVGYILCPDGSKIYHHEKYSIASKIVASIWLRTEATIIKRAMLEIFEDWIEAGCWGDTFFCNFSHDSFTLSAPKENSIAIADKACEVLVRHMQALIKTYDHERELCLDENTFETVSHKEFQKRYPDLTPKFVGYELGTTW